MMERRNEAEGKEIEFVDRVKTPLGDGALVWSERGLRRFVLGGRVEGKERKLERFEDAMGRYFGGEAERFHFKVDLRGLTEFERRVLKAAREIGYGEVRSYSWLAKRAGRPRAARAAGNVMAKNPLPIIIPCHRVIRSDGGLGGFSMKGGAKVKRKLQALERRG